MSQKQQIVCGIRRNGIVTLPQEYREDMGVNIGEYVIMEYNRVDKAIIIKKAVIV